jgi:hypothetical protein
MSRTPAAREENRTSRRWITEQLHQLGTGTLNCSAICEFIRLVSALVGQLEPLTDAWRE